MENCLFCRIISREISAEIVYEDEDVLAFLDIGPISKGHTLIIPKRHAQDLTSGGLEEAQKLMGAVYSLAPKIVSALGATGYNLGMNHGEDAGQEVFHTHLHVMPRYANDAREFVKVSPTKEELHELGESLRKLLG